MRNPKRERERIEASQIQPWCPHHGATMRSTLTPAHSHHPVKGVRPSGREHRCVTVGRHASVLTGLLGLVLPGSILITRPTYAQPPIAQRRPDLGGREGNQTIIKGAHPKAHPAQPAVPTIAPIARASAQTAGQQTEHRATKQRPAEPPAAASRSHAAASTPFAPQQTAKSHPPYSKGCSECPTPASARTSCARNFSTCHAPR